MDTLYARLGGAFPFGFEIEAKKCVIFCTWIEKVGIAIPTITLWSVVLTYNSYTECVVIEKK
jgi:hypothetical protein